MPFSHDDKEPDEDGHATQQGTLLRGEEREVHGCQVLTNLLHEAHLTRGHDERGITSAHPAHQRHPCAVRPNLVVRHGVAPTLDILLGGEVLIREALVCDDTKEHLHKDVERKTHHDAQVVAKSQTWQADQSSSSPHCPIKRTGLQFRQL